MNDDTDVAARSDGELLGLLTRTSAAFGETLLEQAGGIGRLARAEAVGIAALLEGRAIGGAAEPPRRRGTALRTGREVAAAFELGRRVELARLAERPLDLRSAADVAAWAAPRLAGLTHEELWILAVDGRGGLRGARNLARGGLHAAAVRPADPLRAALRLEASAFVLVHNHPSGDPTPSAEDHRLTERVAEAGACVGLALLDHVVVARTGFACVPVDAPPLARPQLRSG